MTRFDQFLRENTDKDDFARRVDEFILRSLLPLVHDKRTAKAQDLLDSALDFMKRDYKRWRFHIFLTQGLRANLASRDAGNELFLSATRFFDESAPFYMNSVGTFTGLPAFFQSVDEADHAEICQGFYDEFTIEKDGSHPEALGVFLVSGDPVYFRKYAERYCETFFERTTQCELIANIVNPDADSLSLAYRLSEKYPFLSVSTTHSSRLAAFNQANRRAYFAIVRFLILPVILQQKMLPCVVTEIDAEIAQDVDVFLSENSGKSVGFCLSTSTINNPYPWRRAAAGLSYWGADPLGQRMALANGAYNAFGFSYRGNFPSWLLDQRSLYECFNNYLGSVNNPQYLKLALGRLLANW